MCRAQRGRKPASLWDAKFRENQIQCAALQVAIIVGNMTLESYLSDKPMYGEDGRNTQLGRKKTKHWKDEIS